MKRTRRSAIVRRTLLYLSQVVEQMPAVDNGLYTGLAEGPESELAVETTQKLAESIRRRAER